MRQLLKKAVVIASVLMITLSCMTAGGCKKKEEPTDLNKAMKKAGEEVEKTGEDIQDAAEK